MQPPAAFIVGYQRLLRLPVFLHLHQPQTLWDRLLPRCPFCGLSSPLKLSALYLGTPLHHHSPTKHQASASCKPVFAGGIFWTISRLKVDGQAAGGRSPPNRRAAAALPTHLAINQAFGHLGPGARRLGAALDPWTSLGLLLGCLGDKPAGARWSILEFRLCWDFVCI